MSLRIFPNPTNTDFIYIKSSLQGLKVIELFDINGMSFFPKKDHELMYLVGLCNSNIINEILKVMNPTLAFQSGDISKIPVPTNIELVGGD